MTDTAEHFDVLIVGAGLSGIGAGYLAQGERLVCRDDEAASAARDQQWYG